MTQGSWWPSTSDDDYLREFLDDVPEFRSEATVCGKDYKCHMIGGRPFWRRTDSVDFDPSLPHVEKCRIDSLFVASKAMGTCAMNRGVPDACRKKQHPVLTSSDSPNDTFVTFSSDELRVKGIPLTLDGSLQCVHEPVRKKTHSMTSSLRVGAISRHEFKRRGSASAEEAKGADMSSYSPSSPSPPEQKEDKAVAAPPSPPEQKEEQKEVVTAPSPPEQKEEKEAAPPLLPPPPSETDSGWRKCSWFSGDVQIACSKDSDCPLPETSLFDAWFDTVQANAFQGTKMKAKRFVDRVNATLTRSSIDYDVKRMSTANANSLTLMEMRRTLLNLFNSDDAFHDSVKTAVNDEPKFKSARSTSNEGACMRGRCNWSESTPRPTLKLFNGKIRATFQRDPVNDKVSFSNDDGVVDVHAVRCDASSSANSICEEEDEAKVRELKPDNGTSKISLIPGSTPVSDGYRLRFGDAVYAVSNRYQLPSGTEDAPAVCAQLLCQRNRDACPAPYCMKSGDSCVPNEEARPPTLLL